MSGTEEWVRTVEAEAEALHHLLTGPIDLSHFDARFRNDAMGAPAYPPATLLQVVLFAYARAS